MPAPAPVPALNLAPAPGPGPLSRVFTPNNGGYGNDAAPHFNWFVRTDGSNNNGGSSDQAAAERSGTDVAYVNGTSDITSASAAFVATDVGKGLCVNTGGSARRYRITAVVSATRVTLDRAHGLATSGLTWAIGGAWADARAAIGDTNVSGVDTSPVAGGDTVWIRAGTYRVNYATGSTWLPSSTVTFRCYGPGAPRLTGYLTSDASAPNSAQLITLANTAVPISLAFFGLQFVPGGSGSTQGSVATLGSTVSVWFERCSFACPPRVGDPSFSFVDFGASYTWKNCAFASNGGGCILFRADIGSNIPVSGTVDCRVRMEGCLFVGANATAATTAAAVGFFGDTGNTVGGGSVESCTFIGFNVSIYAQAWSNIKPLMVRNCVFLGSAGVAITAPGAGGLANMVDEDYNYILASTPRTATQVRVGAHSIASASNTITWAPLLNLGQESLFGKILRRFGSPLAGSPFQTFGAGPTRPEADFSGIIRPRGGIPGLGIPGAFEIENAFTQETTTTHTGSNAVSLTGAGTHDFQLPVIAGTSYQPSIYCNADSSYKGPPPLLQLVNGDEAGASPQTRCNPAQAAGGGWVQISLNQFTAVSDGIVTIRIVSQDQTGLSKVVFDTFTDGKS